MSGRARWGALAFTAALAVWSGGTRSALAQHAGAGAEVSVASELVADGDPLEATHFQIGPRLGGIVAPTFASHPVAGVAQLGLDVGVRWGRVFDLRVIPTFFYEESGYERGVMIGALAASLFWPTDVYGLGVGLGGGYGEFWEMPDEHSSIEGSQGWFAAYGTPVAIQVGDASLRFEISLNVGVAVFTGTSSVKPFGTIGLTLLFWPGGE